MPTSLLSIAQHCIDDFCNRLAFAICFVDCVNGNMSRSTSMDLLSYILSHNFLTMVRGFNTSSFDCGEVLGSLLATKPKFKLLPEDEEILWVFGQCGWVR